MVLGKIGRTLRHEGLPGLWMRLRHPKRSGGAAALTPQQQLPLQLDCPGDDLARALADALDRILGQHWQGAGEAATMLRIDPPPTRAPGQAQTALAFTQPGSVRAWLTGTDPAAARQYGAVLVPDPASLTLLRQAGLAQGRLFLCPALGQPPGPALAGDLARWLAAAGLAEPSHFSPDLFPALTGLRPRDRLCLSLPESLDRRAGFQTQSLPGFRIVDGLRLQPGWQGAGHSHATIARAALTCDAAPIWVCEDDMRPAPGFEAHLAAVEAYLDGRDWDMFSGLLTHTPPDCRIRHVERRGALTFVHLDYATGMVLNLYNRRALERLAAWTPAQGQSETDTVDAWLSRLPGLRAVTTLPFLARHDDAAMSTVFGFANRRYASLIRASESRLSRMAAEWLKRPLACDKRPPPHCGGPPLTTRRRCILHIGTMKTGTTTVQAWLKQNAGWLAEQGWTYPGWPLRHAGLIGQAIQTLPADGNLVISDEGLWHYSGSARSDTAAIAKALEDFDVTVIVYFRRPDHFLESWFKQGTKNGTGQVDISAFLSGFATSSTTFRNRLNRFATLFGDDRLIVAPYERAQMQQGDILADFLHRTGLPQPPADLGAKEKLRENVSPGSDTILLAGLMRQVFGLDQDRIDQILTLVPVENIARARHSLFTREEVAAIRADYRPVFAEIQQRFGSGAAPDFFLDWGDDDDLPPVSPLRLAYDGYLAHPAEPDSTAAE